MLLSGSMIYLLKTIFYYHKKLRIWLSLSCVPWFLGTVYPFASICSVMCNLETRVFITNLTRSNYFTSTFSNYPCTPDFDTWLLHWICTQKFTIFCNPNAKLTIAYSYLLSVCVCFVCVCVCVRAHVFRGLFLSAFCVC